MTRARERCPKCGRWMGRKLRGWLCGTCMTFRPDAPFTTKLDMNRPIRPEELGALRQRAQEAAAAGRRLRRERQAPPPPRVTPQMVDQLRDINDRLTKVEARMRETQILLDRFRRC